MKKILWTGFEPFGGQTVNPSWEAVRRLPDLLLGACILKVLLPVEFVQAGEVLLRAVDRCKPDAVCCAGQAGGRDAVTPEARAVNRMQGRIPDNAGFSPTGEPIEPGGPEYRYATLSAEAIASVIASRAIPARVSTDAGEYVCNDTMYRLLAALEKTQGVKGGFLHLPYENGQVLGMEPPVFSLPLTKLCEALEAATEAILMDL